MAERNLEGLTPAELVALSRSAEAKANVFRGLASRDERYQGQLDEATTEAKQLSDAIKEQGIDDSRADPTSTVPDKEGTAPSLADATGSYASDAEVANLGGIGINDSNADPEGVRQELEERADPDKVAERRQAVEEAQAVVRSGGASRRERITGEEEHEGKTPRSSTRRTKTPRVKVGADDESGSTGQSGTNTGTE